MITPKSKYSSPLAGLFQVDESETPDAAVQSPTPVAPESDGLQTLMAHGGGMSPELELASLRGGRIHELEQHAPDTVMGGGKSAGGLLGMLNGEQAADPDTGTAAHAEEAYNEPIAQQQRQFEIDKIKAAHPDTQQHAFDSASGVMSPASEAIVKSILNYDQQMPTGAALRTPYWTEILGEVAKRDPSFQASQYGTRQTLRKDFTSGPASKNIKSLNTLADHLQGLHDKGEALHNTSVPAWNAVGNFFSRATGSNAVTDFEAQKTSVTAEIATALKGNATDQEIQHISANISAAASPEQLHGLVQTYSHLLQGRLSALQEQYRNGMGRPEDFEIVAPNTQAVFDKFGGQGTAGAGSATPERMNIRGGGVAEKRNGQWVRVQ